MRRRGVSCEAVRQLAIVREFLAAFPRATGLTLRLEPTRPVIASNSGRYAITVPLAIGSQPDSFIVGEVTRHSVKRRAGCEALVAIFAHLFSLFANRFLVANGAHEPGFVRHAKAFIQERMSDSLSLGRVARHVHCSVDHFRKGFAKATGQTFTEYVSRCRVERACELLIDPDTRIADAAFACGFESIPHFNRVFKKHVGKTPTAYRTSLRSVPAARTDSSSGVISKSDKKNPADA